MRTDGAEPNRRRSLLLGEKQLNMGEGAVLVFAGPCAVEDRSQLLETAAAVAEAGAVGLRGGAFKPRTSPYSFQGLGERGLELLAEARQQTGLLVVTEATATENLPLVAEYADLIQIGSRNMQNFSLLRAAGRAGRPVVLKRGLASTIREWLDAAEYIRCGGNDRIILCERGIRTFETMTRNTMDLGAIALLRQQADFPLMADPSHGCGRRELVPALARAALAAGADSLLIEVHVAPERALSDGPQSLNPREFSDLMKELKELALALGRKLAVL
ncbi:MAG: 3-deoxy-7-phosphoheptulonate synthase, partial [Syntrophomonadaceae bacterium]|nr:3-deoxy-7-phosphoheptulonate synthase [Syntrophomonadaceae bacterium]